ncbi:hypothetical protein BX666DRAFT_1912788 [Dichotomocladium elegans]|nr:hypothetical protein BX666DRAFT_1912788 [Dichotomocladium elegans]
MGEILGEYKRTLVSAGNVSQYNIPILSTIEINTVPGLELKENSTLHEENAFGGLINDVCDAARHQLGELQNYLEDKTDNISLPAYVRNAWDVALRCWNGSVKDVPWKSSMTKCMAWHPHRNMLAVAFQDHTVHVYEREAHDSTWYCSVLQHQFMRGITCLEWKKRARGMLAVGCKQGVCVWNIDNDPANRSVDPNICTSASMNYLCYPGHEDIISVAWDPTPASHLLAAASAISGTIVIYDIKTLTSNPLKRAGKGNVLMRWSPDGMWLFVATGEGTSRMWDTCRWRYKDLVNPPGLWVQAACWAPDSKNLFISMHGKSDIHVIYWTNSGPKEELLHRKLHSVKAPMEGMPSEVKTTGIKEIALSSRDGKRLAVIFDQSNSVALYTADVHALPALGVNSSLQLIGSTDLGVSDTSVSQPIRIAYSSCDSSGSTLAVLRKDGKISFIYQVA